MVANRGAFGTLLEPGLRKVFEERWEKYPKEFEKIFNIESSSKQKEIDSSVSGFGSMPMKAEGEAIQYDDIYQGFEASYIHQSYALGFRVSREMWEDDLYGIIKKKPLALARSAYYTVEQTSANVFNNGFANAGYDGVSLFNVNHPREDASGASGDLSRRNRLATLASLSLTSLQQAISDMEGTLNERGSLVSIKPKLLVVPRELKWKAHELLKSELRPEGFSNEVNVLASEDINYFVWHFLTSPTSWFLLPIKEDHELNLFWRREVDFERGGDFETEDAKFKATMRFSVGYSQWRGVFAGNS